VHDFTRSGATPVSNLLNLNGFCFGPWHVFGTPAHVRPARNQALVHFKETTEIAPGCFFLSNASRRRLTEDRSPLGENIELNTSSAEALVRDPAMTRRTELPPREKTMHNRNQCHIDEVAALQQAIGAKELLLRQRQAAFEALEERLNSTIEQLSADLNEKQTLIGQNEIKSQQAKAEINAIVEQKTRLEMLQKQTERLLSAQAEQIRASVRAEIQSLERQLTEKQSELQNCEAGATDLQHRLAEMQLLSETRAVQIEDLKAQNVRLSQEMSRHQPVKLGTGSCASHEPGDGWEPRLHPNNHDSQTAETSGGRAIGSLRRDAEEKHLLLASRNEELMRVKSEMELLQGEVSELKLSGKRFQDSAEAESAKMRTEFQAQLAFLQAELSQRDWALQEGQAAQKVIEQGLRAKIGELEARLAQLKSSSEASPQEFVFGENWESEARLDHTWKMQERLDGNGAEGAQTSANDSGRWRSRGQWKRRWRSR
jgi:chromosome segregation ATPase